MRPTRAWWGTDVGGGAGEAPHSRVEGAETLWDDLAELVQDVVSAVGGGDRVLVCGVGCGGPMTPGGDEVSPLNIPAWRSFPLRSRLNQLTGLPVFVDNDAKALALGEGWVGAAAGRTDYLAMVVSTGVGGGIVLEGRLLSGRLGNAGHIGHIIVVPGGRKCHCGGRGCLEAEASGTALAAITGQPARLLPRSWWSARGGWSVAPSRRWRTSSTCRSPSSADRWHWVSASPSSGPPRRRWTSCAGSSSPRVHSSCRAASATGAH